VPVPAYTGGRISGREEASVIVTVVSVVDYIVIPTMPVLSGVLVVTCC